MKKSLGIHFVLLLFFQAVLAHDKPTIPEADRVRLAEAFRIGEALENQLWRDWDKAPFAVLLITPEYEFLTRHPRPSQDFTLVGYDPLLKSDVYFRKRTYAPDLLATFPAVGGVPTIVMGQAENTSKETPTPWVVTLLHEHFHQLQMSQPNYFQEVEALNLSRGDKTGMWMLNFAFPYTSAEIKEQFSILGKLLAEVIQAKKESGFSNKLKAYLQARQRFQRMLTADDYKYFSFQLWQEGIARYTEYRMAELAAKKYKPSKQFRALKDYTPFEEVADSILNRDILGKLPTLQLDKSQRVAFYPLGAAEGLVLDKVNRDWKQHYFVDKFFTDKYFSAAKGQP